MLLLDEPTNHLDAESVWWLERYLAEFPGTVVAVTHDRYFLDNVAGWILELYQGAGIPWEGNYSSWLEQKQRRLAPGGEAGLGPAEDAAARARVGADGARARGRPRARRASPATRSCARRPSGRPRAAPRSSSRCPSGWATRSWSPTSVAKGFGDRLLFENLSFSLPRGGIVGVIGPNGAGKTTLFRMITGQEQPDAGTLTVGSTVQIAYVDQSRDALDPDKTVYEEISRRPGPAPVRPPHGERARLRRRASTSAAPTSRRRWAPSRAASATGSTWPSCSRAAATCCCSTSPPTTSTWTRSARWRRRCSASPAAPW